MREYQIFADSSCDLPESLLTKYDIKLIPFYVSFDYENYYKENVDITNDEFYRRLSEKDVFPSTSLPSVQDYLSEFRQTLKEDKDLICLCLTQKFSGSYQSALNAKQILEEQYTDADIRIVDSIQATAGEGLLLLQAAYMKEEGYTLDQLTEKLLQLRSTARIMFTLETLDYLDKGRRIGKVAAMAGTLLDLKPLIQLKETELIPYSNVRGRKKALDKVKEMVEEYFEDTMDDPSKYDFCIANATTKEDAQYLQNILEKFIGRKLTYPVFQIGVTIGTYIGPGGIGICFVKKFDCL
jgi:DegV family protein with EDD domain